MDEIIVRVARAVASRTRLQILSRLARDKQAAPTALARELRMGLGTVCGHLRRLGDAGLIMRRRSGRWCYVVGESPYPEDALSGKIARRIRALLADPLRAIGPHGLGELRQVSTRQAAAAVHGLLFEAVTAFTHVRRLRILRRLASETGTTVQALMKELRMSDAAVSRHMSKLLRRGYAQVARQGHTLAYVLSKAHKSPVHKKMYDVVASSWGKKDYTVS